MTRLWSGSNYQLFDGDCKVLMDNQKISLNTLTKDWGGQK